MSREMSTSYFKGLSRKEYIQKAHELISKDGIESVSIRRIASELGCSSASLYRYFDDLSELLYFAEIKSLENYIKSLNQMENKGSGSCYIYVGVWDCFCKEAFAHPEAYDLLFFKKDYKDLKNAMEEYYDMFPEELGASNQYFHVMLQTPDFMMRDFEMCKKCVEDHVITMDNARNLNRIVCMLFKGYFKTALDEHPDSEQIQEMVVQFVNDIDLVIKNLAVDTKGYHGFYIDN